MQQQNTDEMNYYNSMVALVSSWQIDETGPASKFPELEVLQDKMSAHLLVDWEFLLATPVGKVNKTD